MDKSIHYTRGDGILEEFLAKMRATRANNLIPEKARSGRILDIGCGSYPYFLVSTKFKKKYGIDPNTVNAKNIRDIELKKQTLGKGKLQYKDNFFDVVVMLAVFEHLPYEDIPYILKEVNRILKKNGIFIITTPAPWSDKLLHLSARWHLISSEEIHEHKHNLPKKTIASLMLRAGFEKNKIKSGYFEMGLNMWVAATK